MQAGLSQVFAPQAKRVPFLLKGSGTFGVNDDLQVVQVAGNVVVELWRASERRQVVIFPLGEQLIERHAGLGHGIGAFEWHAPYFLLAVLGIFDRDSRVKPFVSHPKAANGLLATVEDLLEIVS